VALIVAGDRIFADELEPIVALQPSGRSFPVDHSAERNVRIQADASRELRPPAGRLVASAVLRSVWIQH
jgi:hypothetical protein